MSRTVWPATANDVPVRPLYDCPGCGAQSTSPLNHDHTPERTTTR